VPRRPRGSCSACLSSLPALGRRGGRAPWSGAPRDFTSEMRRIIESARAPAGLSRWIGLTFGYKSRGRQKTVARSAPQQRRRPR
jgi:hypothetical protein